MKDARHPGGQLRKHEKGVNLFFKSKITPLCMSLATPISKFISNHAKVPLKEIKDMKIDRRKNAKTDDNLHVSLTTSNQSLLNLFNHQLQGL